MTLGVWSVKTTDNTFSGFLVMKLTDKELKLLQLLLDPAVHSGEADACRLKLLGCLNQRGLDAYDLIEAIQSQTSSQSPVVRPNYGLCRMPFGKTKGQCFADLSPAELRSARNWALRSPQLAHKFSDFIHDVNAFLDER